MIYHRRGEDYDYNLDGLDKEVTQVVKDLKPHLDKFDGIVVRGMSGVVVGVPVSLRLKKPLFIIRKDTDDCHAHSKQINAGKVQPGTRWIFLDDFVSKGHTRQVCIDRIKDRDARMIGEYLTSSEYSESGIHWFDYTA